MRPRPQGNFTSPAALLRVAETVSLFREVLFGTGKEGGLVSPGSGARRGDLQAEWGSFGGVHGAGGRWQWKVRSALLVI